MQHKFKMKKIAAAVVLTAGFVGAQTASADAILFPYFAVSSTVTTVASVVSQVAGPLHYIMHYKPVNPTVNTQGCTEVNWFQSTSPNDIVTFDMGGHFGAATGGVLFNDPGALAPAAANAGYNLAAPFNLMGDPTIMPTRGFMIVDDKSDATDSVLYGEAMVMEFGSGAAWGYTAYNAARNGAANRYDFNNDQEINGEVINTPVAGESAPLELLPLSEWTNRLFVTPIDNANLGGVAQHQGGINTQVVFTNRALGAAFDRDENPVSGQQAVNVTCTGGLDTSDLLSSGARLLLKDGGWAFVNTALGTVTTAQVNVSGQVTDPSNEAVIQKLQYNTGSTFNGEAITGTDNSALWLRNNTGGLTAANVGEGSDGF